MIGMPKKLFSFLFLFLAVFSVNASIFLPGIEVSTENTITTEVRDKFNRTASNTRTITLMPPPSFAYDPNGNMTGDGEWVNVFDDADRLVSQTRANDTKLEFSYDGIGRRRIKKTYNWSGTDWVLDRECRFTYDQWVMVGENVLDAQGTVVDEKIYTWGVDLSGTVGGAGGVGGLLAVKDNSGTYYPYFDANGNVIAYTDINGVPVAEYEYSPFGEITRKSGSKANDFNFRFSTQYYDSETELYSFIFRYYSPRYTRWLSRDPIGIRGGINPYQYCYNSPQNYYDLLGLYAKDFHYYAIYYILRKKCWPASQADNVAGWSQYVDDNPKTEALNATLRGDLATSAEYHFPGSSPTDSTVRDDPTARRNLKDAIEDFESGGYGTAARLGASLHAYADTWGHEGYTAWHSDAINKRTGSMRPNTGHADASEGGQLPDKPYHDVEKAIEAAKNIFDRTENKCECPPEWEEVERHLRSIFSFKGDEDERSKRWQRAIKAKFGEKPEYDKKKFEALNPYYEKALGLE